MTTQTDAVFALLRDAVRRAEEALASHAEDDLTAQMEAAADVYAARQTLARTTAASGRSAVRAGIEASLAPLLTDPNA